MNSTGKSIKVNAIMNVILQVSTFIFPLISFPYVSRILLPEGTGKVNMAISFVAYFIMLAQLGLPTYGIIQCAKVRDNRTELSKIFSEIFILNVFTTIASYVILVLLILSIPKLSNEKPLYFVVSLNVIFGTIGIEWLYHAMEEYSYITIRSLITKVIAVAAMFLFVKAKEDYVIYAAIGVLSSGIAYICNLVKAREYVDIKTSTYADTIRHLKPALVFFAVAFTTTIYTNLDNVMLGFMTTDTDVGYYSAAIKIKTILVSVITALGTVLLPRASYSVKMGNVDEFNRVIKKTVNFIAVMAIPVAIYFMLYAEECILFIAGDAYGGAVLAMQVIMPTIIFIGLTNIIGFEILVPTGRERQVLYSTIVGATVDIIINAILIPKYGAPGAAIGTLSAEMVVLIYQLIVIKDDIKIIFENVPIVKIIIATLLAIVVGIFVKNRDYQGIKMLLYSAVAFFTIYGAALILFKEKLACELLESAREKLHLNDNVKNKAVIVAAMVVIAITMLETTWYYYNCQDIELFFGLFRILAIGIAGVAIILNCATDKYNKKMYCIIAIVTAILLVVTYKSKTKELLLFWLFIVAAIDADYTEIIKWSALTHIVIIAGVVAFAEVGILPTTVVDQGGRIREYLGFGYCTTAPNFLFYTIVMWVYWRKDRISWYEILLLAIGSTYLFIRTDTKSAFVLSIVALTASSVLKISEGIRKYRTWYGILSTIIVLVLPTAFVMITIFADINSPWMQWLDRILNGRIWLGNSGYHNYGITLFGQDITFVGGVPKPGEVYNYVDSSYVQILLKYGLIFLVLVLIYLIAISISGTKKKDTYLAVILCLLIVHTTFDPQLVWMEYDIFLMALGYITIRTTKTNEKETKELVKQTE